MESMEGEKPHAVMIPYPAQGHINAALKLAKLLHFKGFHITFVHTEFNYNRIRSSGGPSALAGLPGFRYEAVPDGLPPSDPDASQEGVDLFYALKANLPGRFRDLLTRLSEPCSGVPPVSCVVFDVVTRCIHEVVTALGIPTVFLWSASACGYSAQLHIEQLRERGIIPLKSESDLSNGYLDKTIDWIPGMKNIRLRDFPSFVRTTDPDDIILNIIKDDSDISFKVTAIVINTFDDLEGPVLEGLSSMLPPIYSIGPLNLLFRQMHSNPIKSVGNNLWKEDSGCLEWLEGREPGSVVYVNFGSLAVVTSEQLTEFAWGLANSGCDFLWVIRSDLLKGESAVLPQEFVKETGERGFMTSWCPQEEVLLHPAIGGFLTHCGWNSTLESISGGVPMICWPFFADQQTNCRYLCNEWGIGAEIDGGVRREEVARLIRELMSGEEGKEMRKKASEWKASAVRAAEPGGQSFQNFEKLIDAVLLPRTKCI